MGGDGDGGVRVIHIPTREEVQAERKRRYLEAWPVEKQLEAHTEALQGRPEKQTQMMQDLAAIREALPFCEEA